MLSDALHPHLQLKGGDDGHQVRVARPLSDSVYSTLPEGRKKKKKGAFVKTKQERKKVALLHTRDARDIAQGRIRKSPALCIIEAPHQLPPIAYKQRVEQSGPRKYLPLIW